MEAIVYLGFKRTTEKQENIFNCEIEEGYAKVTCFECEGSKTFTYPDGKQDSCINCKGTGEVYINC